MAGPRASAVRARSFGSGHARACGTTSGFASGFDTGAGRDPCAIPSGASSAGYRPATAPLWRASPRVADLVSLQRLSDRQGHLPLPSHGSEGDHRGGQRHAGGPDRAPALDNVRVERALADGDLPRHGHLRQVPGDAVGCQRDPVVRGCGSRKRRHGAGAVEDPRHPRPVRHGLRRLSVRGHRSDRRPHVIGGLRAGNPDQAPLPSGSGHRGPRRRARASVVRRRRDAEALAADLAE